ncbi:enoyl-CoA hydratase/isomerase [Nocardia sp. NBC_01377]|uniref:enoyl-CoA hydratase/isomerase n=1 Tax=Nocardia sp. NBC_01377 TaxID=2903595 RepID=UPI003247BECF
MDLLNPPRYDTVKVRFDNEICHLQIHRPDAGNSIDSRLIEECAEVVRACEEHARILILEGLPDVFCSGADFRAVKAANNRHGDDRDPSNAAALYDLWLALAFGSFVSIAHVRGKVNAGGVGFVAACDLVIAETRAVFGLSELLFGLTPACVLPFLERKIGFARANHMTLTTRPIDAAQAAQWQLVDAHGDDSAALLSRHLLRLRYLPKAGLRRHKNYLRTLDTHLLVSRAHAINTNIAAFTDPENRRAIARYVEFGQYPWEQD